MKRLLSIAGLAFFCFFSQGCSNTKQIPDPYAKYRSLSPVTIYNQGVQQASKKQYRRASDTFAAFEALYPDNQEYRSQVILDSIYTNYMEDHLAIAEAQCERFLVYYSYMRDKAAYVYYMRGLISYRTAISGLQVFFHINPALLSDENFVSAFNHFNQLVTTFPESKYTPDALQRMRYIRDLVAKHRVLIAQYYYERKAYVASANRALSVVLNLNGVASTAPALQLLYLDYSALGMKPQAKEVKSMLDANRISTHYVPIKYDLIASIRGAA